MTMLTFDQGTSRFNYRVAGIAIDDGHVLIHRAESESFWTMPGGRVEMGEPSEQALRREMLEEIGAEVTVERLLWVVENFFVYDGMECHELAFYYLMTLPPERRRSAGDAFEGYEEFLDGRPVLTLLFHWYPLSALAGLEVLPSFLRDRIADLPRTPEHLVHIDR